MLGFASCFLFLSPHSSRLRLPRGCSLTASHQLPLGLKARLLQTKVTGLWAPKPPPDWLGAPSLVRSPCSCAPTRLPSAGAKRQHRCLPQQPRSCAHQRGLHWARRCHSAEWVTSFLLDLRSGSRTFNYCRDPPVLLLNLRLLPRTPASTGDSGRSD